MAANNCWLCNLDVPAADTVWLDVRGNVVVWTDKPRPQNPAPYHPECAMNWKGIASPRGVPEDPSVAPEDKKGQLALF